MVIQNGNTLAQEQEEVLSQLAGWNIYFADNQKASLIELEQNIRNKEIHFLLFSTELGDEACVQLSKLHQTFPLLAIIYYYSQLKSGEFAELYNAGINYCIIGDARQIHLIKTLNQLWDKHWKRIPATLLSRAMHPLPQRAIEVLSFIENKPIRCYNSFDLAQFLNISESRFRAEFKRYFNLSFREFKQQLFHHYELLLLFDKKLKPGDIFGIFDYKNISAFSRSFRMRHGQTWQQLVRLEVL